MEQLQFFTRMGLWLAAKLELFCIIPTMTQRLLLEDGSNYPQKLSKAKSKTSSSRPLFTKYQLQTHQCRKGPLLKILSMRHQLVLISMHTHAPHSAAAPQPTRLAALHIVCTILGPLPPSHRHQDAPVQLQWQIHRLREHRRIPPSYGHS